MVALLFHFLFGSKSLRRQSNPDRRKPYRLRYPALALNVCFGCFVVTLSFLSYSLLTSLSNYFPARNNVATTPPPLLYLYTSANKVIPKALVNDPSMGCDVYNGEWVYDESYPLYTASSCPFAEKGFRCQENGRSDVDYLKWKWQPYHCDIPRFDSLSLRQRLKGLRVAFVGDSMSRTQWESFICLLMSDMSNKSSVYEVNHNRITKNRPYLAAHFKSYNITVEYFRSPFLVREGSPPKHVPKRVWSTLKLDTIEASAVRWRRADVLVFNTGHWWTTSKTFDRIHMCAILGSNVHKNCNSKKNWDLGIRKRFLSKNLQKLLEVGDSLKLGMNIEAAFEKALRTWLSWVETKIDFNRTKVFFRSFEPAHWAGTWKNRLCPLETKPVINSTFSEEFPHLKVLEQVVGSTSVPVRILNITTMTSYRRDSHLGKWTGERNVVDCGHWCLPGVPDIWNELFYVALMQTR